MAHAMKVKMFGNFRMVFDDQALVSDKMHKESQFNRLMQMMMHYSKTGISKEQLEEYVIGEGKIGVPHTALRVIVYRAKQKLQQLGIPGEDLIYQKKGMYYWTKDIEVIEDTEIFQSYYEKAKALEAFDRKEQFDEMLQYYLEACYTYTGEFLSSYIGEAWVSQEAKKYQEMFAECVNKAAEQLRRRNAWKDLEKLGRYAASVDLLREWEILVLEALGECGHVEEAVAFCKEAVEYYLRECGSLPSENMMLMVDKYTRHIGNEIGVLNHIQEQISEDNDEELGGYECGFQVFKGIYQQMIRMTERMEHSISLLLCTMVNKDGKMLEDEELLDRFSTKLKECICTSIRKSDVFTQYGRAKFVLMLVNCNSEHCLIIQKRIRERFRQETEDVKLEFHME